MKKKKTSTEKTHFRTSSLQVSESLWICTMRCKLKKIFEEMVMVVGSRSTRRVQALLFSG